MNVPYVKLSPTGNVTLLVTAPVPRALQPRLAAALLSEGGPGGEQAGYLEPPGDYRADARLQMMGGEFCGNATMALGALLARRGALEEGGVADYRFEVSGCGGLVPCRILRRGGGWEGTVGMPLPEAIEEAGLPLDGDVLTCPVVRLPGIVHVILPAEAAPDERALRALLPRWHERLGGDALGALTWDEARRAIDPLVYVPSAGTLVRETGCGSGTAAVGCWQAVRHGRACRIDVRQPGGVISVDAQFAGGRVTGLTITGTVTLLEEGTAKVEV